MKNRDLNFVGQKIKKRILNHLGNKDTERIDKKRQEKCKLKLKLREKYLKRLFKCEAQEMQERTKRAREEQDSIKEKARENIIATLKEYRANNGSSIIDCDNEGLNVEYNKNLLESHLTSDNLYKGTLSSIKLKNNYEGFKTTKGMIISLVNLGIIPVKREKEKLNEKGEMI